MSMIPGARLLDLSPTQVANWFSMNLCECFTPERYVPLELNPFWNSLLDADQCWDLWLAKRDRLLVPETPHR